MSGLQNPQVMLHGADQVRKMYGVICRPTWHNAQQTLLSEKVDLMHCCIGQATCTLYLAIGTDIDLNEAQELLLEAHKFINELCDSHK